MILFTSNLEIMDEICIISLLSPITPFIKDSPFIQDETNKLMEESSILLVSVKDCTLIYLLGEDIFVHDN